MKRSICVLLILLAFLGCVPVFASPTSSTDLVGSIVDSDDSLPKSELDWDSFVQEYLDAAQVDPETVAMGYYNTVTGEEHYFRGDVLFAAGNVDKVPLNMYYSEKVYSGDLGWDTTFAGIDYKSLQHSTLCQSSNELTSVLATAIGTQEEYRLAMCPYIGVDPATAEESFLQADQLTPRQMIFCLNKLYSDPERFPGVIDNMLQSDPEEYFEQIITDYSIAQKYGWYVDDDDNYINCVGIVETEEPILLSIFTRNCRLGKKILGDYCALMCEYTDNNMAVRKAAEEEEARKEAAEQAAHQTALDKLAQQEAEAEAAKRAEEEKAAEEAALLEQTLASANAALRLIACLLACVLISVVLGLVARIKKKPVDNSAKPNKFRIAISVILSLVAAFSIVIVIATCIFAADSKPIILSESADPSGKAEEFLDLLFSENPSDAEDLLLGDSKLGLDIKPQDKLGIMLYDALQESFSYEAKGDCVSDSINASQSFIITHLDIPAVTALQQEATNTRLAEYVEAAVRAEEVQAEDGSYLPEVAMRALEEVTGEILENAENYYVQSEIVINMQYTSGDWMIVADESLFTILSGNTAY